MAAATSPTRPSARSVARFGFDHGWYCLNPTFLNLKLPVLIVDHRLLPDPTLLGLEPFGIRNPRLPLPDTTLVAELHPGPMISIWNHTHTAQRELVAWHRSASGFPIWPAGDTSAGSMVVMVGDTHRIQLSWAALWDGHIGRARLIDATRERRGAPAGRGGQVTSGSAR